LHAASSGGTIRRRIARTLALPVVAALALLAVIAVIEVDNYRTAAATSRSVTLNLAVQSLVQELQTERGLTAGLLGGNVGFRDEVAPARQRVDGQRAAVEKLTAGGGEVEDRVAAALRRLDGLAGVRAGLDTGAGERAATFAFFTEHIADLRNIDFGLDSSPDAELRRNVAALEALSDVKEATARERAFLNGVFSASGFRSGEFLQFVTMRSSKDAALTSYGRYADATARDAMSYVNDTGSAREAAYFEQVALGSGDGRYLQVNPQSWWSAQGMVLDDMLRLEQHVGSVIRARAETLQDRATLRMAALLGVTILCFVGSVYLARVASRSIARPLADLAEEANRLAGEQLPEAVRRVTAGAENVPPPSVRVARGASDEVRQVADAFDRVQATAYALATEQALLRRSSAESLANLGRRNQNLLRRQLSFITRLEREESDPTGLANLFELDHLATRMRRNAESLLVLVGAASPRQWTEPLPVTDLIRAAISEVEEYRRVTLRRVDEIMVAGSVVSGLAHMLAELIENGLAFSPPDQDVEIHGRQIGDGYLIAVVDQGVGLSGAELEQANQRLRGEGDFITAPARFLGHYVVGRLAVDMGIDVRLTPSPVTGVTVRITLPPSMLVAPQAVTVDAGARRPAAPQDWPGRPLRVASDLADTAPLRLPSAESAPVTASSGDRRVRPTSVEYVVVDDSATVPSQPLTSFPARPVSPADPVFEPMPDGADRTANGLRKRSPRGRKDPAKAATLMSERPGGRPAPVSAAPEDIRARLTAFRDGVQRGSTENAGRP
jgi:signal transduction histidine kinase